MISPTYEFPENFIWGAATAPHQIEGNNTASDWWAREHSPRTAVSEPSGAAADSDASRALAEQAFLAGWRAAGGELLLVDRIPMEDEK